MNILPRSIAERLKATGGTIADHFDSASVLFADIVDFTPLAQRLSPAEVVGARSAVLSFRHARRAAWSREDQDDRRLLHGRGGRAGAKRRSRAKGRAPRARHASSGLNLTVGDDVGLELRIGINSGPVMAGVIGSKRFLYDLWGDAVNTASRMESQSTSGEIQITRATYELLKDEFACTPRGTIEVKGKGQMETWYLVGRDRDRHGTDHEPVSGS